MRLCFGRQSECERRLACGARCQPRTSGKAFYILWPIGRQGFVDEIMQDLQLTGDPWLVLREGQRGFCGLQGTDLVEEHQSMNRARAPADPPTNSSLLGAVRATGTASKPPSLIVSEGIPMPTGRAGAHDVVPRTYTGLVVRVRSYAVFVMMNDAAPLAMIWRCLSRDSPPPHHLRYLLHPAPKPTSNILVEYNQLGTAHRTSLRTGLITTSHGTSQNAVAGVCTLKIASAAASVAHGCATHALHPAVTQSGRRWPPCARSGRAPTSRRRAAPPTRRPAPQRAAPPPQTPACQQQLLALWAGRALRRAPCNLSWPQGPQAVQRDASADPGTTHRRG